MEQEVAVGTKKWHTSKGRLFVPGEVPVKPRVPFAFKPVEPEILSKWKAPQLC